METQQAKGWIIDPARQTITAASLDWGDALVRIGAELLERVRVQGGDLWVDEEGTLRESPTFWVLNGAQLIAGVAFLCGDDWTDHEGSERPEVAWLPAGRTIEPPRSRAYAVTPDGIAQLLRDAREEQGHAELAAVGSIPAEWPSDGAAEELEPPSLGDFVRLPDWAPPEIAGKTGFVVGFNDRGWLVLRFIDGSEVAVEISGGWEVVG